MDLFSRGTGDEGVWTPLADVMAALMVVFMLLVTLLSAQIDPAISMEEAHLRAQKVVYAQLREVLGEHLDEWDAQLDPLTLAIQFKDGGGVLFGMGDATLSPEFRRVLNELVPKMIEAVVAEDHLRPLIEEIRIEGHTSSEWSRFVTPSQAYLLNMELSQDRTRTVLAYVLRHRAVRESEHRQWFRKHLTANGLSSSRPVQTASGDEDPDRSRRVEIRFQLWKTPEAAEFVRDNLFSTQP